jgi:limonene-1,2-epoxide hydrolase
MGAKQEQAVLGMLAAWGHGKHEPEPERIASYFAPEGVWKLYMPDGPAMHGRAAIQAEVEREIQYVGGFMCDILHIASNDHVVITEREDSFIRNGKPLKQYIAGVFELDDDNLITSYRDYFDLNDFVLHTGANLAAISGLEGPAAFRPVPEATASGLAVAPPKPETREQQALADFCDAWGDGSSARKPDVEKIVSMMSPDAQWQLWMPGGPVIKGREALRAEIGRQMGFATHNKCNIVHSVSTKTLVMQERSDWAVIGGRPCPHQMVAVYDLDADGLISGWREYINMADLDRKMGAAAA